MINFQLGYGDKQVIVTDTCKDIDKIANTSLKLWMESKDAYLTDRSKVTIKTKNSSTQYKIVQLVYSSYLKLPNKSSFDGLILPNETQSKNYVGKGLEFRIGAPLIWLAKLAPDGHFIYSYEYTDNYKSTVPDELLFNSLTNAYVKGYGTKYNHAYVKNALPDEYILFTHQGLGTVHYYDKMLGLDLLKQVSQWALDNKKHVVIRLHPTADEVYTDTLYSLKNKYITFDVDSYIVDLISTCSQLWTASSACGMEAMLMKKPVSIFGIPDYHPAVNNADNIDQAYKPDFDYEKYVRFTTWYARNLCINIHNAKAPDKIYKRMYDYFIEGKTIAYLY
jgi:hypothetical protein